MRSEYKAYEIFGKTLGLIGYGHIGGILAELCKAVGMSIMVYDPFVKKEAVEEKGYTYCQTIEPILANADVISVHVPLTDKTRNLIAKDEETDLPYVAVDSVGAADAVERIRQLMTDKSSVIIIEDYNAAAQNDGFVNNQR